MSMKEIRESCGVLAVLFGVAIVSIGIDMLRGKRTDRNTK